eukprot:5553033-Amphidinium_carterae.2
MSLTLPDVLQKTFGAELTELITERIGPIAHSPTENLVLDAATDSLMPNGLPIPGICHLTHNTVKDVTLAMNYWAEFWQQLKVLEAALTNDEYMRVLTLDTSAQGLVVNKLLLWALLVVSIVSVFVMMSAVYLRA